MLLGIRFPRAHDPYKLGRTFDKGDKQQAIALRVTDQDFAVFIIGVFFVGDNAGKLIRESRSGFFKTNAVFLRFAAALSAFHSKSRTRFDTSLAPVAR
jgi:hypothetical protein